MTARENLLDALDHLIAAVPRLRKLAPKRDSERELAEMNADPEMPR